MINGHVPPWGFSFLPLLVLRTQLLLHLLHTNTPSLQKMVSETFFPMAAAGSVPRIVRKYHYEHFPPPSDSIELTAELRRGLRAVPHGGFWSKVKSAGWRLLRE